MTLFFRFIEEESGKKIEFPNKFGCSKVSFFINIELDNTVIVQFKNYYYIFLILGDNQFIKDKH